jgi:hypothetical protein
LELKRISLKEEDLLYFLHIPKTAGTTLISILDAHFPKKNILNVHEWQELLPLMPINFGNYNFFRGHFGRSVFRLLPKNPISITILRDPIKLMISSYKMVARQPKEQELYTVSENQTLSDLITDPKRYPLTNRQSHHLVAKLDIQNMTKNLSKEELENFFPHHSKEFYLLDMPNDELLEKAKEVIENEMVFFGIVEKMEKSLFLLCYTFGWEPMRDTVRENVSPTNQSSDLTEEAKNKLIEMTKIDQKLYDYANKVFDSRYNLMVKELKEKYYEEKFDQMPENDVVFEMLKKDYKG